MKPSKHQVTLLTLIFLLQLKSPPKIISSQKILQVAKETQKSWVVIIWYIDFGQSEKPFICFAITNNKSALGIQI